MTLQQRGCLWLAAVVVPPLVMVLGCREPVPAVELRETPRGPTEMPLDNEQYSILEMATAHGALTIEIEVDADAKTMELARQLVEPIRDQYAEVLVYFYDRAGDHELPMTRVQWTEADEYTEVRY